MRLKVMGPATFADLRSVLERLEDRYPEIEFVTGANFYFTPRDSDGALELVDGEGKLIDLIICREPSMPAVRMSRKAGGGKPKLSVVGGKETRKAG